MKTIAQKIASIAICGIAFCAAGGAHAQVTSQLMQDVIASVNIDSVTATIKDLSGERDVIVNRNAVRIPTRVIGSDGRSLASQYLIQRLKGYGLTVTEQQFSSPLPGINLIGEQPGTVGSTGRFILCAHYDDLPTLPAKFAPGADDNATGVAAVIEAARILSHYRTRATITYALWDCEEAGLYGSLLYADAAKKRNDNIAGVVNVDMMGWDGNNDGKCDIHLVDTAKSKQLADTMAFLNRNYSIGLAPVVHNPGELGSDHGEFLRHGYSAVLLMEDYAGDFNPHYHSASDSVKFLNLSYLGKTVKLSIATIAAMADVQGVTSAAPRWDASPAHFSLHQNYPNPFNPSTTFSFSLAAAADVSLRIFDVLGRERARVVGERLEAGTYRREWDASGLSSGVYLYRLEAGGFSETKKFILLR